MHQDAQIDYLSQRMTFLRPKDTVLLCYPNREEGSIGWFFAQAVSRRGAAVVWMDQSRSWKDLLRQAFSRKASVIVGDPLVILGLTKLAKFNRTPLYIRHAVTAGAPCRNWMRDALVRGLDCNVWGCFDPDGRIAGFSCANRHGVHLWEEAYGFTLCEDTGELLMTPREALEKVLRTGYRGVLSQTPCPCGCPAPLLRQIEPVAIADPVLEDLNQQLHNWSSILDCRIRRGLYGLELELIVFPGEKLPPLPSRAKQVVRAWDPERDVPFGMETPLISPAFSL